MDPEGFNPHSIIRDGVVEVHFFENSERMTIFLEKYQPTEIILLDPQLQFLRCVEIFHARNNLKDHHSLKVSTIFSLF